MYMQSMSVFDTRNKEVLVSIRKYLLKIRDKSMLICGHLYVYGMVHAAYIYLQNVPLYFYLICL